SEAAMSTTRIAVIGAGGRMGRAIVRAIAEGSGAKLTAAVDRAGSADLGSDAGTLAGVAAQDVAVAAQLPAAGTADVWIDFSAPAASVANARAAVAAGTAIVI